MSHWWFRNWYNWYNFYNFNNFNNNYSPTAVNDIFYSDENAVSHFDILSNDYDSNGDSFNIYTVNGLFLAIGDTIPLGNGYLTWDGSGNFTFEPGSGYDYLAEGDEITLDFNYNLRDTNGAVGNTGLVTLTLRGTNDVPVVTDVVVAAATEDDAGFTIDLLAGITDPDQGDSLLVHHITQLEGRSEGWEFIGNTLEIDPSAFNDLANGETEVLRFNFHVVDGNGGEVYQNAEVTIQGVNDVPVITSFIVTPVISEETSEDSDAYSIDLLEYASDVDASDVLGISGLTQTAGRAAGWSLNGNSLDIDPAAFNDLAVGESETLTFEFLVDDGNGGQTPQTLTVNVEGANDAPVVAAALDSDTNEDAAGYSVDLLAGASDVDASDVLGISGLTQTAGRAAGWSLNGNSLDIDPAAFNDLAVGESETLTFEFLVDDGNGGQTPQTLTVNVEGANDAPVVAAALDSDTNEDAAGYSVDLLAGASDVDASDVLGISGLTQTAGRAAGWSLNGNSLDIDPAAFNDLAVGESETLTFEFLVDDGNGGQTPQTLTVNVEGANDAPVVAAALDSDTNEDAAGYSVDLLAGASDVDASDVLGISGLTQTAGRAAGWSLNGNSLDIDPAAFNDLAVGESETLTFEFLVDDGNGGQTPQTLTVNVEGANDAPVVAAALDSDTNEDAAGYSVDLLAGASDVDASDVLGISGLTQTAGRAAGWSLNGNSLDIDPAAFNDLAVGESETLTFEFLVDDGNGGQTPQTLTVNVEGANDAPVVAAALDSDTNEDAAGYSVDLLAGASDVDASDVLGISGLTQTAGRAAGWSLNGNSLDIDPAAFNDLAVGESETLTFEFLVDDGNGGQTPQTLTVNVEGANDAPVVAAALDSDTNEDAAGYSVDLLAGASDVDASDVLGISGLTQTAGRAAGWSLNGNSLDIDPAAFNDLAVGESETLTFEFLVDDGNGGQTPQTLTVNVEGANDAPVVAAALDSDTNEDAAGYSVDLLAGASDVDASDVLGISGLTQTAGRAAGWSLNGNSLDIDPAAFNDLAVGESETLTFEFLVDDGNGGQTPQTLTVNVEGANDAPVVAAALDSDTNEDAAGYSVDLLAGASDVDASDVLGISGLTQTAGRAAGWSLNGNSLDIDPAAFNDLAVGESETLTFEFLVDDGNGGQTPQTLTVNVEGANDAPVVAAALDSDTNEDAAGYSVDLLAGASDVDASDVLGISSLTQTAGRAAGWSLNGNSLDIDPAAFNDLAVGESETLTFEFLVDDGNGGQTPQTLTVNVEGANDAPVVAAALDSDTNEDAAGYSVDLLAGASDVDASDVLGISGLTQTAGRAAGWSLDGTSLDIDPSAFNDLGQGDSEILTFTYVIDDGNGGQVPQSLTVTVAGINDAPVLMSSSPVNVSTGSTVTINSSALSADDVDNDASEIIYVIDQAPDNGSLTLNGNAIGAGDSFSQADVDSGALSFTHDGSLSFEDSFVATLTDVDGGNGGSLSFDIYVDVSLNLGNKKDTLTSGPGDDYINGENGKDVLEGSGGNDTVIGENGDDSLYGSAGHDILSGDNGDDLLDGGSGNDSLDGGKGADILIGGTGNDFLTGGKGDDLFIFSNNSGSDVITDFSTKADEEFIDLQAVTSINSFADVLNSATQDGNDTVITLGNGSEIKLIGVKISDLSEGDFFFG